MGLIFCYGCQSGSRTGEGSSTTIENDVSAIDDQAQKQCFLRTEGTKNQDSLAIQFVVREGTVSGTYNVIPYEKDSRRGSVMGKANDNVLDLVWTYTQEGMQDTMRVVFALREGKLLQKPLSADTLTGRQFTDDSSPFSAVYEPTDCGATP